MGEGESCHSRHGRHGCHFDAGRTGQCQSPNTRHTNQARAKGKTVNPFLVFMHVRCSSVLLSYMRKRKQAEWARSSFMVNRSLKACSKYCVQVFLSRC